MDYNLRVFSPASGALVYYLNEVIVCSDIILGCIIYLFTYSTVRKKSSMYIAIIYFIFCSMKEGSLKIV